MIEINYNTVKGYSVLSVNGHAGYKKAGEDIVCSAVSILVYVLADNVELFSERGMLEDKPILSLESGETVISFKPKHKYKGEVDALINALFVGFKRIATEYPDNVQFIC